MNELTRVASSMFVAIFEALFHVRLEGIIRSPHTTEDYEINVQRVIDGLGQHISMNLQHIPGKAIVQGDFRALSNLVHIFVHFCPKISSDDKALAADAGVGAPAKLVVAGAGATSDIDSISTKESTFEERPQSAPVGGRTYRASGNQGSMLALSTDMVQKLCEEDARQMLLSTEAHMFQEERLEEARRRREDGRFKEERRLNAENRRRLSVTRGMQQKRWQEDAQREQNAHSQRQASEEHAMLRQIYTGLLNKLHTWRRSERQEARERVCRMRDEAKSHVQALQTLFEDRVALLRQQNTDTRKDDVVHERSHRRMGTDLLRSYNGRQKRTLETHHSLLIQQRQDQLLKRKEAHKNLLALLSVESWQDGLRSSDRMSSLVAGVGSALNKRDFVF